MFRAAPLRVSIALLGSFAFAASSFAQPGRRIGPLANERASRAVGFSRVIVSAVDGANLPDVAHAVERAGGTLLITSDHGNAEMMRDPSTGQPHTAHTLNPVPVILFNPPKGMGGLLDGRLADVAPTILKLLGLPQPEIMTGRSLLLSAEEALPRVAPRSARA